LYLEAGIGTLSEKPWKIFYFRYNTGRDIRIKASGRSPGKNTCIDKKPLENMVKRLISCDGKIFDKGLNLAIDTVTIKEHKEAFQLPAAHLFERRIEEFITDNRPTGISENIVDDYLNNSEYNTLTREQRTAVKHALSNRISAYYGRGGRGKTFALTAIAEGAENLLKNNVILSAVAAKACRRISQETGRRAHTIASLLHFKNEDLSDSIIIVDEASMLSLIDAYQLIRKLPSTANLCLLGDPYQIPSVDAGRVFYDIIQNEAVPLIELTINKRQDSKTDTQLNQILSGQFPVFDDYRPNAEYGIYKQIVLDIERAEVRAVQLYRELLQSGEEVQIISPLKQFSGGSDSINRKAHVVLFQRTEYCEHTPVVWTKNTQTEYGIRLTNGSLGFVKGAGDGGYYLDVVFEHEGDVQLTWDEVTNHLEMAYCLTVHKAAGSEWDNVVIVLPCSLRMVDRNMVYTALSRCKKRSIVIYHDHKFVTERVQAPPVHERRRSLFLSGCL